MGLFVVLAIASLAIVLVGGGGTSGALVQAGVIITATVFALLGVAIASLWRRGRFRLLNGLRILVLVLLGTVAGVVLLEGTVTVAGFLGDNRSLPATGTSR